jgi:uncharacterized membrane protein
MTFAKQFMFRSLVLGLAGFATACSTIVEGTDQNVTVTSEPDGAVCELMREGQAVGAVNSTPGLIEVDRSSDDITVKCEKEGYLTSTGELPSEFEGMTLGNAIFGGIIGVAVDASTGAASEYPESINIVMIPANFPSEIERDLFFDNRIVVAVEQLEAAQEELSNRCGRRQRPQELCENDQEELQTAFDEEFAEIERMRGAAAVETPL